MLKHKPEEGAWDHLFRQRPCGVCGDTLIIIRNAQDAYKPKRILKTRDIRLEAIHLKRAPAEFLESATNKLQFENLCIQAELSCS